MVIQYTYMLFGKYINKYYKKYFLFYLIGVLCLIGVDYLHLYIPQFLGQIVGMFDTDNSVNMDQLTSIILALIGVAVGVCIGRVVWRLSLFNASKRVEADIRKEMFLKSERLSQRYYHENKVGTIMSWCTTDVEEIQEFLGWGSVMLVDAVFQSVFVIYKMIKLDWVLSIIAFIPMLLIIVWGGLVEKFMDKKWTKRQKLFDDLYDYSQESFTGIRVIKAFVKETQQIHEFAKIAKKNKDIKLDFTRTSVLFDVIIEIIITLILSLILGLGGWFVYCCVTNNPVLIFGHTINLNAAKLITFIGYFDLLVWPLMALGQIVTMRGRAKASYKRIAHFLDEQEEIKNPENAVVLENVKGKITFNNYNFSYPDSTISSLKNVSFTIEPGETVGIIGKIGSGKTTLVNSLLRLYNVSDNSILIDDVDIMKCDIKSLRDCIAYVPQDNFLFSDKIRNNIAFSNRQIEFKKIKNAAKFADVDDNIAGFKDGYDTLSGERGVSLSGGQKQRISIARAYLKDAPIMIMDDSVSAVDVKTEETILKNIKENRRGKTTIVIASRVSTVSHLNKILVLNEGQVEAFDTPQNLLKISPTYQNMVRLQTLEAELERGDF